MGADGRNIRAASVNSQWIMGDIDWSPDSRKIAYTMSTEPLVRHVDLFVTDLMKDEVRRLTTRGTFGPWDQYRWDPAGKRLYFTAFYGWTDDEANRVFNVNWVDASGAITGTDRRIVGDPQGLARDGAWALVTRSTRTDRGPLRELARVPLTGGEETVLATGDVLQYAKLLERDDEAVLVSQDLSDPYSDLHRYDLVGLAQPNDVHAALPVAPNAASVALLRAGR
jgi:hypothetical protein